MRYSTKQSRRRPVAADARGGNNLDFLAIEAENLKDAAVVVRLPPGGYTVTVSGVPYTTGHALVEIYDLDP